jgi:hypothetical protein
MKFAPCLGMSRHEKYIFEKHGALPGASLLRRSVAEWVGTFGRANFIGILLILSSRNTELFLRACHGTHDENFSLPDGC